MNPWSTYFKEYNYERASKRKHRKCPKHKRDQSVCPDCIKVVCDKCGHKCVSIESKPKTRDVAPVKPKKAKKIRMPKTAPIEAPYLPPAALKHAWAILGGLGAIRIDAHEDSGHWMAVFPKDHFNVHTAGDLADRVWLDPKLRIIAKPTAFRAGRILKPERWWVSFELKKG